MNSINIGLIECGTNLKPLYVSPVSISQGYSVKKILSNPETNKINIRSRYPLAEIVESKRDIFDDKSIDLVIVSGPSHEDMELVGEAIQAGKQIRII
ncbi:MAG: hypothetical protein JWP81_2194 [Ferruginibacter sp.]|nr:hypothetical protein [Ferruginibacter sp.]